jgi:hypothetical protein
MNVATQNLSALLDAEPVGVDADSRMHIRVVGLCRDDVPLPFTAHGANPRRSGIDAGVRRSRFDLHTEHIPREAPRDNDRRLRHHELHQILGTADRRRCGEREAGLQEATAGD